MKMTKADKEFLRAECAKRYGEDGGMADWKVGKTSAFIDFGDVLVTFDRPHVKTDFWFGEHTYDYDEVVAHRDSVSKSEDWFIKENLRDTEAGWAIGRLDDNAAAFLVRTREDDSRLAAIEFESRYPIRGEVVRRLADDEAETLRAVLEDELAKFEKRLRSYLKRYGLTKCRYSVYWADR